MGDTLDFNFYICEYNRVIFGIELIFSRAKEFLLLAYIINTGKSVICEIKVLHKVI